MLNALKMVKVDAKTAYYRIKADREVRKLEGKKFECKKNDEWFKQAVIVFDAEKKWSEILVEKEELYLKASLGDYAICGLLEGAMAGAAVYVPLAVISNLINRVGA